MAPTKSQKPSSYPLSEALTPDSFLDRHDFLDDIHGQITLNQLERDAIDTPEFQRLFRTSQLGFVDLVYHTANHTRAVHSIGTCAMAQRLLQALSENVPRFHEERRRNGITEAPPPTISKAEGVLIRLGALLHDLSHGPFSHDIERKTHRVPLPQQPDGRYKSHHGAYDKHDDYERNPALYILLLQTERSVLARLLISYSPAFWQLLVSEQKSFPVVGRFLSAIDAAGWSDAPKSILPNLLFHLLTFEEDDDIRRSEERTIATSFDGQSTMSWGLGPAQSWGDIHAKWYQPFRHDIIGNTLSADLLDYLQRDLRHLGIPKNLDLKLLKYYTLAPARVGKVPLRRVNSPPLPLAGITLSSAEDSSALYRCAIDLNDYKRGTVRSERINDVFRLLDLRHEIHEKAVFHRVAQSARAMLCRSLLILGDRRPAPESLYGLNAASPTLSGDEDLLARALNTWMSTQSEIDGHQSIPQKLLERRVYRPLVIVPGNRVGTLLVGRSSRGDSAETTLRALAAILDTQYFAPFFWFVSWCIENVLVHALESEEAVDAFAAKVAASARLRDWALSEVRPQRVIFWTTPYKQLYKDPALLIRVGNVVAKIEDLRDGQIEEAAAGDDIAGLRERALAGMANAERKYEALWKFYVFLSDGLFYTGVLARILRDHPCGADVAQHKVHLGAAENLALRAVRTAWELWESRLGQKDQIDLSTPMRSDTFSAVLGLFADGGRAHRTLYSSLARRVSAVSMDQYLHGSPPANCRDVRYRFDRLGRWREALEGIGIDKEAKAKLLELLPAMGLNLEWLPHEEILELASRLAPVADRLLASIKLLAAQGEGIVPEALICAAWRGEPGGLEDLSGSAH